MSSKELAIETIRKLPEDVTLQQISDELATLAAIQRGEEDVQAGRFITHEQAKQQLSSWISK
jgi:predicted transcriptional regulator